jgi:putative SOS response-associated peptidase YedK
MCGRFTLTVSGAEVAEWFGLAEDPTLQPRYNLAPTQPLAIIREAAGAGRQLTQARWGLIPSWASDAAIGNRMINARAETVADKPAFRAAFRKRRCLVPASGYYEWKKTDGRKQPYLIGVGGHPFAFAGLWEMWDREGEPVESCALLTTEANGFTRSIHDRMPVILAPADYGLWLDPTVQDPAKLQPLLRPYLDAEMVAHPVSTWVNDPRHEGPRCVEPAA